VVWAAGLIFDRAISSLFPKELGRAQLVFSSPDEDFFYFTTATDRGAVVFVER
jgi:hypothetical protein